MWRDPSGAADPAGDGEPASPVVEGAGQPT
jgi:hypothetical protein